MIGEPIRAAVISDTHGLLRPEVEKILQSCDVVIHAGDFDNQMVFHKLKIKRPLYAVRGNNDSGWAEQLPLICQFTLGGFSFLLTHDQADIPKEIEGVHVVIFGHSHMPVERQEEGRLWLNPGSCGYRRFTLPLSMVVLTLEEKGCEIEKIVLVEDKEGGEGLNIQKEVSWFSRPQKAKKSIRKVKENLKTWDEKSAEEKPEKEKSPEEKLEKEKPTKENLTKGKSLFGFQKGLRDHGHAGTGQKDQLFVIAKIMRLMRRGEQVEWVAKNMRIEPAFVETVYRICVTHPQADARQILDKLEVNRLFENR